MLIISPFSLNAGLNLAYAHNYLGVAINLSVQYGEKLWLCGCAYRALKGCVVRFFKFSNEHGKKKSVDTGINRKGWEPNTSSRVCSDHFVIGRKRG